MIYWVYESFIINFKFCDHIIYGSCASFMDTIVAVKIERVMAF